MSPPVQPDLVECVHCDFRLCVHEPRVGGAACPGRRRTFFSAKPAMVAGPVARPVSPRAARLKLMDALVGLGTALCASYWEPDKWLVGGCDCEPVIEPPYEAGGADGIGCPDIRDALARVRARAVPAPCAVVPERGELAAMARGEGLA